MLDEFPDMSSWRFAAVDVAAREIPDHRQGPGNQLIPRLSTLRVVCLDASKRDQQRIQMLVPFTAFFHGMSSLVAATNPRNGHLDGRIEADKSRTLRCGTRQARHAGLVGVSQRSAPRWTGGGS